MDDTTRASRCIFLTSNKIVNLPKEEQLHVAIESIQNFIDALKEPQPPIHPPNFDEYPEVTLTRYVDAFTPVTPNVLDASAEHHRKWYTSLDAMVKGQERILTYFLKDGKTIETDAMNEYIKRVMLQILIPGFNDQKNTIIYTLEATYRQFMYLVFASILTGITAKAIEDEKIQSQVSIETSHLRNSSILSIALLNFIKRLVVTEPEVINTQCPGTKKCHLCSSVATERAKMVLDLKKPSTDDNKSNTGQCVTRYVFCKEHRKLAESLCTVLLFEKIMRNDVIPAALKELKKTKGDKFSPQDVFNHIAPTQLKAIRASYTHIFRELGEYFPSVPSEARAMEMMGTFIPCEIDVSHPHFNPNNLAVKYDSRPYAVLTDSSDAPKHGRKRRLSKESKRKVSSKKYAQLIQL